jgi:hypothetical protein
LKDGKKKPKKKMKKPQARRVVYTNSPSANMPPTNAAFASNLISTTHYTPVTFLPLNLISQFKRVAK